MIGNFCVANFNAVVLLHFVGRSLALVTNIRKEKDEQNLSRTLDVMSLEMNAHHVRDCAYPLQTRTLTLALVLFVGSSPTGDEHAYAKPFGHSHGGAKCRIGTLKEIILRGRSRQRSPRRNTYHVIVPVRCKLIHCLCFCFTFVGSSPFGDKHTQRKRCANPVGHSLRGAKCRI